MEGEGRRGGVDGNEVLNVLAWGSIGADAKRSTSGSSIGGDGVVVKVTAASRSRGR